MIIIWVEWCLSRVFGIHLQIHQKILAWVRPPPPFFWQCQDFHGAYFGHPSLSLRLRDASSSIKTQYLMGAAKLDTWRGNIGKVCSLGKVWTYECVSLHIHRSRGHMSQGHMSQGHILTHFVTNCDTRNTPKEWYLSRKRVKEWHFHGHFHEWVKALDDTSILAPADLR